MEYILYDDYDGPFIVVVMYIYICTIWLFNIAMENPL